MHGHEVEHAQCAPASGVGGVVGVHVPIRVHAHAASTVSGDVMPPVFTHLLIGQIKLFYRPGHVVQAVECTHHAGELVRVALAAALVFGRGAEPAEAVQKPLCGRYLSVVRIHLVLVGRGGRGPEHDALSLVAGFVELFLAEGFHEAACRPRVFLFGESRSHEGDDDAVAGLVCGVAVGGVHEGGQSQPFHARGEVTLGVVGIKGDHAPVFYLAVFAACAGCFACHVGGALFFGGGFLRAFDEPLPRHGGEVPLLGCARRDDREIDVHSQNSLRSMEGPPVGPLSGVLVSSIPQLGSGYKAPVGCVGVFVSHGGKMGQTVTPPGGRVFLVISTKNPVCQSDNGTYIHRISFIYIYAHFSV